MKLLNYTIKLVLVTFSLSILLGSCSSKNTGGNSEEEKEPSNKIIRQNRDTSDFTRVSVAGSLKSKIKISDKRSVQVVGREKSVDYIETKVSDQTLYVGIRKGYSVGNDPIEVRITVPALEWFGGFGSTKTEIKGLSGKRFEIEMAGASKVQIQGKVETLEGKLNGAASVVADELRTTEATLSLNGDSRASLDVSKSLAVTARGSSVVEYTGSPTVTKALTAAAKVVKKEAGSF